MSELRGIVKDFFHVQTQLKELRETRIALKEKLERYTDKIVDYLRSRDADAAGFKFMGYDFSLKECMRAVKTPLDSKINRVEAMINELQESGVDEEMIKRIIKAARSSDKLPSTRLVYKKTKQ